MKRTVVIIIDDFEGKLEPGDDIQIHRWQSPTSEGRDAVADGVVREMTDLVD